MRVFNLADKLIEERQKNKELEEEIRNLNYTICGLSREIKEEQEHIKIALDMCRERQGKIDKAIDHLTIKQARYINEKDYVLNDEDLDEIMNILQGE